MFTGKNNSANINGHVYLVRLKKGAVHGFALVYINNGCI